MRRRNPHRPRVEDVSTAEAVAAADVRLALGRQLEEAKYEASLCARRHGAVDPDKRLVARELEARWERALAHVAEIEERIAPLTAEQPSPSRVDREALLSLAHDLHAAWNAPTADARTMKFFKAHPLP